MLDQPAYIYNIFFFKGEEREHIATTTNEIAAYDIGKFVTEEHAYFNALGKWEGVMVEKGLNFSGLPEFKKFRFDTLEIVL